MGHMPGFEYRHLWASYRFGIISESEFLAHYYNPDYYWVEHPNAGHGHELDQSEYPFQHPSKVYGETWKALK